MAFGYLKVAFLMMRSKPVRSILSLLGIYIGVLALVIILSIGAGIKLKLKETFGTRGARVVFIHPGYDPVSKKIGIITLDDLNRLREVPGILSVMQRLNSEFDVRTPATAHRAKVLAVDEKFISLYRVPLVRGRGFLPNEISTKEPLCLLSADAVRKLFPTSEPIGAGVEMNGLGFEVIGVFDWNTETGQRTSASEVDVLLPMPWLMNQSGVSISFAEVRTRPDVSPAEAVALVKKSLSRGDPTREKLYFVRSIEQFMERSQEFADRIQWSLLSIAAISLLVGGIGVANVMVTSVTERTREIGVRKALGAQRLDILMQFLVEAAVLSTAGGVLAVVTGAAAVSLIQSFIDLKIPLAFPTAPILGCLGLTVIIGLIAGVYPASRAAALSPAEALRYE